MLDELFEALFERRKKRYHYEEEWEPPRGQPRRHWEDVPPGGGKRHPGRPPRRYQDDDGRYEYSARYPRRGWDEEEWDDDWEHRYRYRRGDRYALPPKKKPWWKKLGDLFEFGD
ncbi:hypothetical protein HRbin29_01609 [bacterium HR29]|jgi:hypothetical protein|nr:hypothetical protein HRbin29_01609 [bacterium HR29]